MENWALKRYVRKVSRGAYVKALDRFIKQYEQTFGLKAKVELKLYSSPRLVQTWLSDDMPEDSPTHRLPATKLLTDEMWREACVVDCIVTPADEKQARYISMFASVQAKGRYPRQITFYAQAGGGSALCHVLKENSLRRSGFARGGSAANRRCHHSG